MSDKLVSTRKKMAELLMTKGSSEKAIQELAKNIGIEKHQCESDNSFISKCIKCGKCVKVCSDTVGVNALKLVKEGNKKEVGPISFETAYSCIGCGSCVYVCPVSCIEMEDVDDARIIHNWKVKLKLNRCKVCNNLFAPKAQLEYIKDRAGLPDNFFDTCTNCK